MSVRVRFALTGRGVGRELPPVIAWLGDVEPVGTLLEFDSYRR